MLLLQYQLILFLFNWTFFYRAASCTTDMWIYDKLEWKNMLLSRFMICEMLCSIPALFKELTYCYLWLNLTLIRRRWEWVTSLNSEANFSTQQNVVAANAGLFLLSFFFNVLELLKLHTGCIIECLYFCKRFSFLCAFVDLQASSASLPEN